jgi:hypothetical protein
VISAGYKLFLDMLTVAYLLNKYSIFSNPKRGRAFARIKDYAFSTYEPDTKVFSFLVIGQLIVLSVFLYAAVRSVKRDFPTRFCLT